MSCMLRSLVRSCRYDVRGTFLALNHTLKKVTLTTLDRMLKCVTITQPGPNHSFPQVLARLATPRGALKHEL